MKIDRDMDRFEKYCESRGVKLLPHQYNFARSVFANDEQRSFLALGPGSGKTLTLELLESFESFENLRPAEAN